MKNSDQDADFYFSKGEKEKLRNPLKAIEYYEKALEINPEREDILFAHSQEVYLYLAGMMWSRGRIIEFIKELGAFPRRATGWYKRAVGYEIYGAHEQAILSYSVAIKKNTKYVSAYHRRGCVYETQGKYNEAILDYTMAIKIRPEYAPYYVRRGIAYCSQGKHNKAILDFAKAIEIDPKCAWAYYNRGKAYSCQGEYDNAVSDYTKAIEKDPKAIAYRSKEDYDRLWDDTHRSEEMGYPIDSAFLKALRKASGRES
jgi:tetratricopeptide (TPR) repeat protein